MDKKQEKSKSEQRKDFNFRMFMSLVILILGMALCSGIVAALAV
jgi:hypothetical protein